MRVEAPVSPGQARSTLPPPFLFRLAEAASGIEARAVAGVLAITTRSRDAASVRALAPIPVWDHVGVLAVRHGRVRLEATAGTADLAVGDVAVLDFLLPVRLCSDDCEDVLLVLPRVYARALLVPGRHGSLLRAVHPASELLASYVSALAEPGSALTAREGSALAEGLATLVAACADRTARGDGGALRSRLTARIDEDLASVDLSPARLAAELGVSRATLYRAVPGVDGIAGLVRERRLDRAFELLSDPAMAGESLGSIARTVGFSGTEQLSRLFLARFGQRAASVGTARRGPADEADGGRIAAFVAALDGSAARAGAPMTGRVT